MYDDLDLACGYRRRAPSARFQPSVPKGAIVQKYATLDELEHGQLDITALEQTHIIDLPDPEPPSRFKVPKKSVKAIVSSVKNSVGAIAYKNGIPFASCILISPSLILTARHAIEGLHIPSLELVLDYELKAWWLGFGNRFTIHSLVEHSATFDYAILSIGMSVVNYQAPKLNLQHNQFGVAMLVSHPHGEPKQVAIHQTLESHYYMYSYVGFQDSYPGSSGGAYFNSRGEVIALHRLYGSTSTSVQNTAGVWLADIYMRSGILKQLYDINGNYRGSDVYPPIDPDYILPTHRDTLLLRRTLERVYPPPAFPQHTLQNMSFHHIIPIGLMEFLWLLSRENSEIHTLLRKHLVWQGEPNLVPTINAVAWARWNLVQGPTGSLRSDDPQHDTTEEEKYCPILFNPKLWLRLHNLLEALLQCREARRLLIDEIKRNPPLLAALQEEKLALEQDDRDFDRKLDACDTDVLRHSDPPFALHRVKSILNSLPQHRHYREQQKNVATILNYIISILHKNPECKEISFYKKPEWVVAHDFSTDEKKLYRVADSPEKKMPYQYVAPPGWVPAQGIPEQITLDYKRGHLRHKDKLLVNRYRVILVSQPRPFTDPYYQSLSVSVSNRNSKVKRYIFLLPEPEPSAFARLSGWLMELLT